MYRERHALECCTNGRSTLAANFDSQLAEVITSIELNPAWMTQLASLASTQEAGPSVASLRDKLRKLGVAYADTGMSDREYRDRKAAIEIQLKQATSFVTPSHTEAAELFNDIPQLWKEATSAERRKLISPLIERVYVNMELKQVGAIVPTPAFRTLLQCAVQKSRSEVVLVNPDDLERPDYWSWWRRGGIHLPQLHPEPIVFPHPLRPEWCAFGVGWVA